MHDQVLEINQSSELTLKHGQFNSIKVVVKDKLDLVLTIPSRSNGSLLLETYGSGNLNIVFLVLEDSDWSVLMMNQSDESLTVVEDWQIRRNASIALSIGEMTQGQHQKDANYNLLEEGSSINVRGATLVQSKLSASLTANHFKGNTWAQIDNYGIVLKECEFSLEVIGKIEKAAKNAKTHQTSRVMNFDERPKTFVNPKLIINENEVEASHAASMGQPDEIQVYYLQSRGLNRSESLKLISLGYLLPIVNVIENEVVKEKLKEAVITKVSESCLM